MPPNDDLASDTIRTEESMWNLVVALAGSATSFEVAEAVAREAGRAAGGTFANVAILSEDTRLVQVVNVAESDAASATFPRWRSFNIDQAVPACDAIRTGLSVLLESLPQIQERYPTIVEEIQHYGLKARVSIPLRSPQGVILGALGIGWPDPQSFTAAQLRRLDLIAQVTELALQESIARSPDARGQQPVEVLETLPNAVLSIDSDMTITYLNAEGERLLGSSRSETVGRRLFEVFPDAAAIHLDPENRAALESGSPIVFERFLAVLGGWFEIHIWPDQHGLNVYFSDISARRSDEMERQAELDEAKRANARLYVLAEIEGRLSGVHSEAEVFERLSRAVVAYLADWCTVVVPSDQQLDRVAAAHRLPVLDDLAKRLVGNYPHAYDGPSPGVVVYRSKEPLQLHRLASDIVGDLDDSQVSAAYGRTLKLLGDGPGVILPIMSGDEVAAVLTVVRSTGIHFTDDDVELLIEVGTRVSKALQDARTLEAQTETAAALQAAALPRSLPEPPGLTLAAGYRAASSGRRIGGDWYDAFELATGRIALVVGDAAGHGVEAAALMTQMRNALRAHLFASLGPAEALTKLSEFVANQEPEGFATIVCLEVDTSNGNVIWASAGHPAPIVLRHDGASVYLSGRPGPPIGFPHPDGTGGHPTHEFRLMPTDRLVIFTDGLIERRGVNIDIGLTHLMLTTEQTRRYPDPATACEQILQRMLGPSQEDDVCLLIADYLPEGSGAVESM